MSKSHAHVTHRAAKSDAKTDAHKGAKAAAHKSSLAAKAAKAAKHKPTAAKTAEHKPGTGAKLEAPAPAKSRKKPAIAVKPKKTATPSAGHKPAKSKPTTSKAAAKVAVGKPAAAKPAVAKAAAAQSAATKPATAKAVAAKPAAAKPATAIPSAKAPRASANRQHGAGTVPAPSSQNQETKPVMSKSTAAAVKAPAPAPSPVPQAAEAAPAPAAPAAAEAADPEEAPARKLSLAFSQPASQTVSGQVSTAAAPGHAALEGANRAFRDDPLLDKRIIEGMLDDKEGFLDDMHVEGFSREAVIRRAAELGLSEALIRQVKGVAADLAGERPGKRPTPNSLGARTCLQCDRVFFSSGPGNRLCTRCRGGDAGLAQL